MDRERREGGSKNDRETERSIHTYMHACAYIYMYVDVNMCTGADAGYCEGGFFLLNFHRPCPLLCWPHPFSIVLAAEPCSR